MEGKISGSFPGGPRKRVAAAERTSAPRLRRVEDIEELAVAQHIRRTRDRRRRRAFYAVMVSVAISGATGWYLGIQNRSSVEEVRAQMAAQRAAESGGDMGDMSSEVNRVMLELWRMEAVEHMDGFERLESNHVEVRFPHVCADEPKAGATLRAKGVDQADDRSCPDLVDT